MVMAVMVAVVSTQEIIGRNFFKQKSSKILVKSEWELKIIKNQTKGFNNEERVGGRKRGRKGKEGRGEGIS